eukprot:3880517-Pleurochrysis_carterae.AAC.2
MIHRLSSQYFSSEGYDPLCINSSCQLDLSKTLISNICRPRALEPRLLQIVETSNDLTKGFQRRAWKSKLRTPKSCHAHTKTVLTVDASACTHMQMKLSAFSMRSLSVRQGWKRHSACPTSGKLSNMHIGSSKDIARSRILCRERASKESARQPLLRRAPASAFSIAFAASVAVAQMFISSSSSSSSSSSRIVRSIMPSSTGATLSISASLGISNDVADVCAATHTRLT